MMDPNFRYWIKNLYDCGDLTPEEIKEYLKDPWKAWNLLEEYINDDRFEWGKEVQEELNRFMQKK